MVVCAVCRGVCLGCVVCVRERTCAHVRAQARTVIGPAGGHLEVPTPCGKASSGLVRRGVRVGEDGTGLGNWVDSSRGTGIVPLRQSELRS